MIANARKALSHLCLIFCVLLACAGCTSPEAQQAMTGAQDDGQTFPLLTSSGSSMGLRESLPLTFPKVSDLYQTDSHAQLSMINRFRTADYDADMELVIYAYALEQLGNISAVNPLRQFLKRAITDQFTWSHYFAAHAILGLTGQLTDSDTNRYTLLELQALADTGKLPVAAAGARVSAAAKKYVRRCTRQYLLVDDNNQPLATKDGKRPVIVGYEYACPKISKTLIDNFFISVADGGGSYTTSDGMPVVDGKYTNYPTQQFDCAGYAFRAFHNNNLWWVEPDQAFEALSAEYGVGALEEIWEKDSLPGDKVFYFTDNAKLPSHVAEVHTGGGLLTYATVWNADEKSGLWEAKSNASYYNKCPNRKFYRMKFTPKVIPDPEVATTPGSCTVDPVKDGDCPDNKTTTTITFKIGNACEIGAFCDYCSGPSSGSTWNGELEAIWYSETVMQQLNYSATSFVNQDHFNWTVTFYTPDSGIPQPYNGTLTVTHDKITGTSQGGNYTLADGTWINIKTTDINLEFSGKNVGGTLVLHLENGQNKTIEVSAGFCNWN